MAASKNVPKKTVKSVPLSILDSQWLFIAGGAFLFLTIIWGAITEYDSLDLSPYFQGMGYILLVAGLVKMGDMWFNHKKFDTNGLKALLGVIIVYALLFMTMVYYIISDHN